MDVVVENETTEILTDDQNVNTTVNEQTSVTPVAEDVNTNVPEVPVETPTVTEDTVTPPEVTPVEEQVPVVEKPKKTFDDRMKALKQQTWEAREAQRVLAEQQAAWQQTQQNVQEVQEPVIENYEDDEAYKND